MTIHAPDYRYAAGTRYRQLALLLDSLHCLSSGWYRVEELGDYLGVSRRTAYRLHRVLTMAGLPIVSRKGRMGTRTVIEYHLDPSWWRTMTPRSR